MFDSVDKFFVMKSDDIIFNEDGECDECYYEIIVIVNEVKEEE